MNKEFTNCFERVSKFALIFSMIISGGFVFAEPLPSSMPEEQDISSDRLQLLKEMSQMYVDEGRVAALLTLLCAMAKSCTTKPLVARESKIPDLLRKTISFVFIQ